MLDRAISEYPGKLDNPWQFNYLCSDSIVSFKKQFRCNIVKLYCVQPLLLKELMLHLIIFCQMKAILNYSQINIKIIKKVTYKSIER